MTEQGLKAVVYPELDDAYMDSFIKEFSEKLSSSYITVGATVVDSGGGGGSGGSSSGGSGGSSSSNGSRSSDDTKKVIEDAVDGSLNKDSDDEERHRKRSMPTNLSLRSILTSVGGVASAVGVGAIGVATATVGIFKFLESTSEPLRSVMNLFKTAFDMIWMPIGTVIAIKLMPVLQGVFTKVGDWLSIAMDVFEKEGLVGMVGHALKLTLDIMAMFVMKPELWEFIGRTLWTIAQVGIFAILAPLIGPDNAFKYIQSALDFLVSLLSAIWHFLTFDFDALGKDFEKMGGSVEKMFDSFWSKIPDLLQNAFDWIKNNTLLGKLVEKLIDYFGLKDKIDQTIEDYKEVNDTISKKWDSGDYGSALADVGKNYTLLGVVGKATGLWHAEGGVATRPTIAGVGEAGPEAIIPLNQFSSIMNEYSNSVGGGTSNNITININGGNAMEIGEEVQRVLEKTVGKASSKMMWW